MNNEAILSKLIELGYAECVSEVYKNADGMFVYKSKFNPLMKSTDAELIKQALFDECAKQNMYLTVMLHRLIIERSFSSEQVYEGDTSRESFINAFKKVTGIL